VDARKGRRVLSGKGRKEVPRPIAAVHPEA
jgi:hypothetical protein